MIQNGTKITPLLVLSMCAKVQLCLGKYRYDTFNLSVESRQIPYGWANIKEEVESIERVYVTTQVNIRILTSTKHRRDVEYICK